MDELMERVHDKFGAIGLMLVLSMLVLFLVVVLVMVLTFAPYLLLIPPAIGAWMVWSVRSE